MWSFVLTFEIFWHLEFFDIWNHFLVLFLSISLTTKRMSVLNTPFIPCTRCVPAAQQKAKIPSSSKKSQDNVGEPGVGMSLTEIADASLWRRDNTKKNEKPGSSRGSKEYVPGLGTANYAFLIVLFQAQKGPEGLEYLSKSELMDRAESSGLLNKPIHSEGKALFQNSSASWTPPFVLPDWCSSSFCLIWCRSSVYSKSSSIFQRMVFI